MKKLFTILSSIALLCACAQTGQSITDVEKGFSNVPDDVRIGVYWYWLDGNITKEGVIKDLQSMKDAGIGRAYIGDIGGQGPGAGPVVFLSEEWWDIVHTAMKTASELGIDIGMFNSPGWSQSGGPWVSEDQAMRRVAFSSTSVTGDGTVRSIALPDVPAGRIIRTYAFPTIKGATKERSFSAGGSHHLKLDKSMTVRSLMVTSDDDIEGWATLSKGGEVLREFHFDRRNHGVNVGFIPSAWQIMAIPDIEGDDFTFTLDTQDSGLLKVALSEVEYMEEYAEKSFAKMYQSTLPPWDYYMWDTQKASSGAKIDSRAIIDLAGFVSNNGKTIKWAAPEGDWTVVTAYAAATGAVNGPAVPAATGLEADKMSKEHIRAHFDAYTGEILRRIPAEDRTSFKFSILDSYEMGGQNWTDGLDGEFEQVYGYDMLRFLPVLEGYIVDSEEESERFLWDLRRLVADKVAYDYVGGLKAVSNENGLQTWLENYGHWGFPGEFLLYGGQSDDVAGEFWAGDDGHGQGIELKDAASCGHIYGKKQIWAESSTSGDMPFQRGPDMLKKRIDRSFALGINSTLLHVYISQPNDVLPGVNSWFGTEFNRHNTWFSSSKLYTDYLRRCNFVLQQGRYIADLAYFIGEDAPKMAGDCTPELPEGYSHDFINAEVLRDMSHVENGELVLDSGMRYRVLVLPDQKTMRPEMLEVIAGLVEDGLTVVGPAPQKSPSLKNWPEADKSVCELAARLWNSPDAEFSRYGKGKVYGNGIDLGQLLAGMGVKPDCLVCNKEAQVEFIHRELADAEIYFLTNQGAEAVSSELSFRDSGYSGAELWDATTGFMKGLECTKENGRIKLALDFGKNGSAFVVLRNGARPAPAAVTAESMEITNPWKVEFDSVAGNEGFTTVMDKLEDWAESSDERIRYFSGTAHYSTTFSLEDASAEFVELSLGKVMVVGDIKVNGQYAGGVWTAPYKLDITDFVKEGENSLEISVTNNWVNRLIGDNRLPESERGTWTFNNPGADEDTELQQSGIIGPVRLLIGR